MIYVVIALAALLVAYKIFDCVRVKKMTKEKLIEKCKNLIDSGRVSAVQSTLLHHPKLLLLHFTELQTTLTEYARAVEEKKQNN